MIKAKVAQRRKATPPKNGADRRERKRRALVKRLGEEAAKKAIRLALVSKSLLKSGLGVRSFSEVLAEVRAGESRRICSRIGAKSISRLSASLWRCITRSKQTRPQPRPFRNWWKKLGRR